jgi:hypothetical protein
MGTSNSSEETNARAVNLVGAVIAALVCPSTGC